MRKKGNTLEFADERREEVLRAIREEASACQRLDLPMACRRAVLRPASRFWVSEERAARVISAMFGGAGLPQRMEMSKRRMYEEIFRRTQALRRGRGKSLPLAHAVREVVYQPAPEHYMSPVSAMNMYYAHLRGKQKLRANG